MTNSVCVTLLPQFVETTDTVFNCRRLHEIQRAFLNYDDLSEFTIITAPTGTGKSFAFPLPIIRHRQNDSFDTMRCVIISPTNALIEDMKKEYGKTFPELRIAVLNRQALDELNARGPARWDALFEILTNNEVIITNPDLLNFVMFGGYIRHKGQHEVTQIFARIAYFVFDEYHLYDEEQIANIISWTLLAKATASGKEIKFIFASATAEIGLVEVLKQQGFEPKEIVETISAQQTETARSIHGKIEVTFLKSTTPQDYILSNSQLIRQWMKEGEKVLVIFDRMIELRKARPLIEQEFEDIAIAEESGYFTKSGIKEDTTNARLILATNKVEVGVNLNVTVCLMQTGKHFSNFIQRFGRVAREGKDGKVVVFLENKIKEVEGKFSDAKPISYYDFIERCRSIDLLLDRRFYTEKIPQYLGAYFYVISRSLKDYNTRKVFTDNLRLEGQAKYIHGLLYSIEIGIKKDLWKANKECGYGYKSDFENWKRWWEIFVSTFKYFRASKPDVWVRDLDFKGGQLINYSLEWILRNREVIGTEEIDDTKCFIVSGFLEGKNELQYYVESMPIYLLSQETMFLQQSERYNLKQAFEKRVSHIADTYYRHGDVFRQTARQLLGQVLRLKPLITEKRMEITDIKSFSNII